MVYEKHIENLEEMKRFAEDIATHLFPGFVLCLSGDLGAGKTTFTKYLGAAMGIRDAINSPTFTIMKQYVHSVALIHIDAYRLEGAQRDFELEEHIYSDAVIVIEWYEYIIESIPDDYLSIHMTFVDENRRRLFIEGRGRYADIAKAVGA